MAKRRFASTSSADQSATDVSRYGSNHVTGHTRGWDVGVEVHAYEDMEGNDCFDIWTTGGSHDSNRKTFVGRVECDGRVSLGTMK